MCEKVEGFLRAHEGLDLVKFAALRPVQVIALGIGRSFHHFLIPDPDPGTLQPAADFGNLDGVFHHRSHQWIL